MRRPHPATFSIAAYDGAARGGASWGVAVASKFLGVGAVVPWARAGAGAVATQAFANTGFGPRGLERLAAGQGARAVLDALIAEDEGRDHRQLGVVDARGESAAHTGAACHAWAGHRVGPGYACQGNILAGPAVVAEMARAFEAGAGGPLSDRLLAALRAGQSAGGDRRGQQSAAILVVRAGGGYGGYTDQLVNLRVDDHREPTVELTRLYALQRLYFGETAETVAVRGEALQEVQRALNRLGYAAGAEDGVWGPLTWRALEAFCGTENLEMRLGDDPARLERDGLDVEIVRFMHNLRAADEPAR